MVFKQLHRVSVRLHAIPPHWTRLNTEKTYLNDSTSTSSAQLWATILTSHTGHLISKMHLQWMANEYQTSLTHLMSLKLFKTVVSRVTSKVRCTLHQSDSDARNSCKDFVALQ